VRVIGDRVFAAGHDMVSELDLAGSTVRSLAVNSVAASRNRVFAYDGGRLLTLAPNEPIHELARFPTIRGLLADENVILVNVVSGDRALLVYIPTNVFDDIEAAALRAKLDELTNARVREQHDSIVWDN
jgi:hypothetical protein